MMCWMKFYDYSLFGPVRNKIVASIYSKIWGQIALGNG